MPRTFRLFAAFTILFAGLGTNGFSARDGTAASRNVARTEPLAERTRGHGVGRPAAALAEHWAGRLGRPGRHRRRHGSRSGVVLCRRGRRRRVEVDQRRRRLDAGLRRRRIAVDRCDRHLAANVNDVWVGTGEAWPRKRRDPRRRPLPLDRRRKDVDARGAARHSQIARVILDPRDPKRIIVAALGDPFRDTTERGVFRSTDGGKTWQRRSTPDHRSARATSRPIRTTPTCCTPECGASVATSWSLTSGGDDDGLYKSTDGGVSWHELAGNGLPAGPVGRIASPSRRATPSASTRSSNRNRACCGAPTTAARRGN